MKKYFFTVLALCQGLLNASSSRPYIKLMHKDREALAVIKICCRLFVGFEKDLSSTCTDHFANSAVIFR